IQPVHRRPGGDDERRFLAHLVRDMSEGIDVVDSVFGKAAIGAEAVGPVPLRAIAVIQARGVHALAAAQTAATPGMHLDRDAVAMLQVLCRKMKFRPNCPRAHDAPYERSIPNRRSRFGYEYANQSPVRLPLPIFSEIPPMPFTKWDDDLGMTALGATPSLSR